jgi:hypothetical protein
VDPRAGLDCTKKLKYFKLARIKLRHLGRPVRNQSLYRGKCVSNTLYFIKDFSKCKQCHTAKEIEVLLLNIAGSFSRLLSMKMFTWKEIKTTAQPRS